MGMEKCSWGIPHLIHSNRRIPRKHFSGIFFPPPVKRDLMNCFPFLHSSVSAQRASWNSAARRAENFICLLIPLPSQRILLIAEPAAIPSELEAVTAELQKTKRILTVKETELKAVLVQADEVSHTDALTFLPNRRQIIKDLQEEVIFSDRYGTPVSISLLDIDHFKKINDTYGHTVGDEVLRTLASELRDHIRYPDTIGRYGGEEFLIVLSHSTLHAAAEQAGRLCKHVQSLSIKSGEHKIAVTISIGVAQYKIHKEDWEAFLSRADAALYQAKNSGRNQWAIAEG